MNEIDRVLDVFLSAADADENQRVIDNIDQQQRLLAKKRARLVAENKVLLEKRKAMVFDLMNCMSYRNFKNIFGL